MAENALLIQAMNAGPEIYQPVYGHEEYDDKAARPCRDRLPYIKKIYDALSKELGRPLRVLDLGCNLGFFSLNIAEWGGTATGIDFYIRNIDVCNILASEHSDYKVRFSCDNVEKVIPLIGNGEYDLVLGLNILHHLCIFYGTANVVKLMQILAERINAGIFELALKKEAYTSLPSRYKVLPDNHREFLIPFDYVKLLGRKKYSEDSDVARPIYYVSKKFIYTEELGLMKIDKVQHSPLYNLNGRKYFFCGDKFVKELPHSTEIGYRFAREEIDFLKDMDGKKGLPKLIASFADQEDNFTNYIIVMERLDGVNLSDKLETDKNVNHWEVARQILEWMIFLEDNGYCNFDVDVSNFLYEDDGKVTLIDCEYIFKKKELPEFEPYFQNHFPFPPDPVFQFFRGLNGVFKPFIQSSNVFAPSAKNLLTAVKKYISPKKYAQIVAINDSEKVFERIYEILFESDDADDEKSNYTLAEREILAIEDYLDRVGSEIGRFRNIFGNLQNNMGYLHAKTVETDQKFGGLANYLKELEQKNLVLNAKNEQLATEAQQKDVRFNELVKIVLSQQQRIERLEKIIGGNAERND